MIGATVRRELFDSHISVFIWGFIGALAFLGIGMLMAYIAIRLGHLDRATAIFGFTPGGLTGMAFVADEEGANVGHVVVMHVTRVFLLFLTVPYLVRWLLKQ